MFWQYPDLVLLYCNIFLVGDVMKNLYYIVETIFAISIFTNIIFSNMFNKNIKLNYYGSKNKKRIMKLFKKHIINNEKREQKIMKKREEKKKKKMVRQHLIELKMERLSQIEVDKYNKNTLEKAKQHNRLLTLEIEKIQKLNCKDFKEKKKIA